MMGSRSAGIGVTLLLLAGVAGCASDPTPQEQLRMRQTLYDAWDTNRDSLLDTQEFAAGPYEALFSETYSGIDVDGDGFVTDDEFRTSPQWRAGTASGDFTDWDTDGSGSIDVEEFHAGTFERWDADGNGRLDRREFYAGAYDAWDTDDDGRLSDEEFEPALDGWPGDPALSDFASWDRDGDGTIDSAEFEAALAG